MSVAIKLPIRGEMITLIDLHSGEQDNKTSISGYQEHPENAEAALEKMLKNSNLIFDMVSTIFREPIDASAKDTIINYLTLFEAYKKISGDDGGELKGTPTNDLFFATWVNFTCYSKNYKNIKKITSYQAIRDARVLCGLENNAELNYEDYMVSSDSLSGETIDFIAANKDYSVQFMVRVPVVKVPSLLGEKYRISNDKAKGFMYPNSDSNYELVIPTVELFRMIEENLKDKKKVRFTSEEAQRSLQEYVNTEDSHIDEILNVNSYLTVGTLNSERGIKRDDISVDDTIVTINESGVYLMPKNSNDVRGKGDIYDEANNTVGGVTLNQRSDTKYTLDSAKLYIVKLTGSDGMDVNSEQ